MCETRMITRGIVTRPVDTLMAGDVDGSPSRGGPLEDDIADEILAIAPPKSARTVSPRMTQEPSNDNPFPASQRNLSGSQRYSAGQNRGGERGDTNLSAGGEGSSDCGLARLDARRTRKAFFFQDKGHPNADKDTP